MKYTCDNDIFPVQTEKKYIPKIKSLVASGIPLKIARAIKAAVIAGMKYDVDQTYELLNIGHPRIETLFKLYFRHIKSYGKAQRNKRARKRK